MSQRGLLDIHIHPLVLIQITDQYVRARVNKWGNVIGGAILASLSGRRLDITQTFEVPVDEHFATVDREYFEMRLSQYQAVLPDVDHVGWYRLHINDPSCNLTPMIPLDDKIVSSIKMFTKTPLLLLVQLDDVHGASSRDLLNLRDLPVRLYEWREEGGFSSPLDFTLSSGEAERIAVDHIAKKGVQVTTTPSSSSTRNLQRSLSSGRPNPPKVEDKTRGVATTELSLHLSSETRAIEMMIKRLRVVEVYVKGVMSGRLHADPTILREIATLCNAFERRREHTSNKERAELDTAFLSVFLAVLTKEHASYHQCCETVSERMEQQRRTCAALRFQGGSREKRRQFVLGSTGGGVHV